MLTFEYLVILGLVGFYLYDSAKLCFYNEFYITKGFFQKIDAQMLTNQFSVFKKFLMIPQPFCPQYLCFKARWQLNKLNENDQVLQKDIHTISDFYKILRPLQYLIYANTIFTLILLPLALVLKWGYLLLAVIITLIYLINFFNILVIFFLRNKLQLSNLKFIHLLTDALFCPPFALNLLQKICLNYEIKSDAVVLCQQLLAPDEFQQLLQQIIDDIELLKHNHDSEMVFIEQLNHKQIYLSNLLVKS